MVCEVVPKAPSAAVKDGTNFGTPIGSLRRMIAGDVDVIVLKALAKEPGAPLSVRRRVGGGHPALPPGSAGAGSTRQLGLSHIEAGTPAQDDGGRRNRRCWSSS